MTKKIALLFIWFLTLGLASQANATILDWDLGGPATSTGDSVNTLTFMSGGHSLQAKGYCSANSNGSGSLSGAHIEVSGGGLGGDSSSCGGGSTGSANDSFVLLEFDSFMLARDFKISFKNSDADSQVWFGPASGGAGLTLTGACITGCGTTLASLGFTNTAQATGAPSKSRYVVISGALSAVGGSIDGNSDYFKISSLTAQIPAPSPLALLALGLIAIALSRRRYSSQRLLSFNR